MDELNKQFQNIFSVKITLIHKCLSEVNINKLYILYSKVNIFINLELCLLSHPEGLPQILSVFNAAVFDRIMDFYDIFTRKRVHRHGQ